MEPPKGPGFVRSLDVITRDALIRTMTAHLGNIEDFCEEIRFSREQSEATFRKLLTHLDAEPMESWATSQEV